MKNYKEWYTGDEMPGRGVVAYDKRHDDVEIVGFTSALQIRERLESKLEDHKGLREWHKSKIKDLDKQIRQVKSKIK